MHDAETARNVQQSIKVPSSRNNYYDSIALQYSVVSHKDAFFFEREKSAFCDIQISGYAILGGETDIPHVS